MTHSVWPPSKELTAAIVGVARGLDASRIAEFAGVLNAIEAAAVQQRRIIADAQQRITPAIEIFRVQQQRVAADIQQRVLPAIESFATQQQRMVADILERTAAMLPANLRGVADLSALENIVTSEGIPLAHVPRADIVRELIAAVDYPARRAVLASCVPEVVQDCLGVLNDPLDDPDDEAVRVVAYKAARALDDGHPEAAQALAVLASEQFINDNIGGYRAAVRQVKDFIADEDLWFVAYYNAFLPLFIVPTLYTSWRPADQVPPPIAPSRHVTVHQVAGGHLNTVNAVIALLQVSGLIGAARWMYAHQAR